MAVPSKLEQRRQRLHDLQVENDLLRETLAVQCHEFDEAAYWIEQAYATFQMVRQNRAMFSSFFSFFSSKK